jgi:hypothetical protein
MVASAKSNLKVFLSHSSADRQIAWRLAEQLRAAGFDVWMESEVLLGQNWAKEIGKALESCDAMVVILSPDATRTEHVQRGINFALVSPQYENGLISVIVRPTAQIPAILQQLGTIDGKRNLKAAGEKVVERLRELATKRSS